MLVHTSIVLTCLVGALFTAPLSSPSGDENHFELLGGGFEGDMLLTPGVDIVDAADGRGVAIFGPRQWPNNIIPYDISQIIDAGHVAIIEGATKALMNATSAPIPGSTARKPCITFRRKLPTDKTFVKIQYGTGCSASVGYSSTAQRTMTLQNPGCFRSGTVQHEFLHVLGFYHEQSRPDRDSYLTVNYANIETGKEHNFNKYVWGSTVFNQNTVYDFGSIMHYSGNSFSNNGKPTLVPKQAGVIIGQRDKLSATDVAEIRAFYSCIS